MSLTQIRVQRFYLLLWWVPLPLVGVSISGRVKVSIIIAGS